MNRQARKELRAAKRIARTMRDTGGPDLTGLSDEELLRRIRSAGEQLNRAMARTTVTAEEASKSLQAMGKALKHGMPPPFISSH